MTTTDDTQPTPLQIVRGHPSAEELAALTAVVSSCASGSVSARGTNRENAREQAARRGRWQDPAAQHRAYWFRGPNGWRASAR